MSGNCLCCYSSFFWIAILALFISVQIAHFLLSKISAWLGLSKVYKWIAKLGQLLMAILAVFLAILANHKGLQSYGFSLIAKDLLLKDQPLDNYRCELVRNLHGRVLEIGPGPGTNFRCWSNNTAITEWVGVEPNTYFQELLLQEKAKRNISFPTSTVWLKGENVDVEPESFDFVVATHVLCSVDDVGQVIHQAKRALKPGGSYYFLEHVAADPNTQFSEYALQQTFQPLISMIGAGCQFKDLWKDLSTEASLQGYEVELKHEYFPMTIFIFSPHVIGTAKKPF